MKHQTQPTACTCVQTCIAMCLDVDVSEVVRVLGSSAMDHRGLLDALNKFGVLHNQFVFGQMVATGWYFATVPSLNHPGGNHQVLMSFDVETGRHEVLDPAILGRYKEDGSDLRSWSELVYFHPGGRIPKEEGR